MLRDKKTNLIESIIDTSVKTSYELKIDFIIIFSDNIIIANIISKYRPSCLIAFPTTDENKLMNLRMIRGIFPVLIKNDKIEDLLKFIIMKVQNKTILDKPAHVIVINAYIEKHKKYKNGYHLRYVG